MASLVPEDQRLKALLRTEKVVDSHSKEPKNLCRKVTHKINSLVCHNMVKLTQLNLLTQALSSKRLMMRTSLKPARVVVA